MLAFVDICLHLLLFETGQTFRPIQTDAISWANDTQHCCDLLRPFARAIILQAGTIENRINFMSTASNLFSKCYTKCRIEVKSKCSLFKQHTVMLTIFVQEVPTPNQV